MTEQIVSCYEVPYIKETCILYDHHLQGDGHILNRQSSRKAYADRHHHRFTAVQS